jgi:hypothetical protein
MGVLCSERGRGWPSKHGGSNGGWRIRDKGMVLIIRQLWAVVKFVERVGQSKSLKLARLTKSAATWKGCCGMEPEMPASLKGCSTIGLYYNFLCHLLCLCQCHIPCIEGHRISAMLTGYLGGPV